MNAHAVGLTRCPVSGCPLKPLPWFCHVHWAFVSPEVRRRIVQFTKTLRGNGVGDLPPTLSALLTEGAREIMRTNAADRLAVALHVVVCGRAA